MLTYIVDNIYKVSITDFLPYIEPGKYSSLNPLLSPFFKVHLKNSQQQSSFTATLNCLLPTLKQGPS